jgi:hypothetical protein
MFKVIFENIFRLSPLKTAIKDFIINEAMTRQIIFDKSELGTTHGLVCKRKVSKHSNRVYVPTAIKKFDQ